MDYLMGALAGLVFGGAVGYLKNYFVWQRYLKKAASDSMSMYEAGSIYAKAMISYGVNVITLIGAFLLRNVVPFDGTAFLIGTAVALAVINRGLAIKQQKSNAGQQGGERT